MLKKADIRFWLDSCVHSYSQMFFSDNKAFAYLIMLATFLDFNAGVSGLMAVCICLLFSHWLGLNRQEIQSGFFSFNGLMIGLVTGIVYQFSFTFFLLLIIFSIISVLITNAVGTVFTKYSLPVLGLPFILTSWLLIFATHSFSGVRLNDYFTYSFNHAFLLAGFNHVAGFLDWLQGVHLPRVAEAYFKSLGAIYLQYNVLAGLLIATGLLIYSRIAFTLSVVGFISGYYSFYLMHGDTSVLSSPLFGVCGFNFILASVSVGGFYLIPSVKSYSLIILLSAVISVLISSISFVLVRLHLPIYSLPSSLVILFTLLALRSRVQAKGLSLVPLQLFSPEKNLYRFLYQNERNKNEVLTPIGLPFYGEWYVSQGHDGTMTHKGDWRHAWDFVVTDEMKKTFRLPGRELTDFFCYNVPVTAPAGGYVVHLNDDVEDNLLGDVNILDNWGNTIIIRHAEGIYTKISHLKQGSFKVKAGDYVYPGTVLATCGNSGRSPEPHIHFQVQETPDVKAKTLRYPIHYYVVKKEMRYEFHSFDYPKEEATIANVIRTPLLGEAFGFVPGQKLTFEVVTYEGGKEKKEIVSWEAKVDVFNQSYLYCPATNSYAYFVNNYTVFYGTDFYGDKKSLLYKFFLSAHKIVLGYYHKMKIKEQLPVNTFYSGFSLVLQDVLAPFFRFVKADYYSQFIAIDDYNFPNHIEIEAQTHVMLFSSEKTLSARFVLADHKIESFTLEEKNKKIIATCISNS